MIKTFKFNKKEIEFINKMIQNKIKYELSDLNIIESDKDYINILNNLRSKKLYLGAHNAMHFSDFTFAGVMACKFNEIKNSHLMFDVDFNLSHDDNFQCWFKVEYHLIGGKQISKDYYCNFPFETHKELDKYFETKVNMEKLNSYKIVNFKTSEEYDRESKILTELLDF